MAGDDPQDPVQVAERLARLIAQAELTEEVIRFLIDEARLIPADRAEQALESIVGLFNWSLANGIPVQKVAPQENYRALETRQRCAEAALLATLNALNRRRLERMTDVEPGLAALAIDWPNYKAVAHMFERIHLGFNGAARLTLLGLDYSAAFFPKANLVRASLDRSRLNGVYMVDATMVLAQLDGASLVNARLDNAKLDAANLIGANLDGATLRGASLYGAILDGATFGSANLKGWSIPRASLRSADLSEAESLDPGTLSSAFGVASGIGITLLPEGVSPPVHWHVAEEGDEDGAEHREAYDTAYRAWRSDLEAERRPG